MYAASNRSPIFAQPGLVDDGVNGDLPEFRVPDKVSTMDVRQRLGDMLNRVALRHDEFIIERKGKPLAALVPVERLEQRRRAETDR